MAIQHPLLFIPIGHGELFLIYLGAWSGRDDLRNVLVTPALNHYIVGYTYSPKMKNADRFLFLMLPEHDDENLHGQLWEAIHYLESSRTIPPQDLAWLEEMSDEHGVSEDSTAN